MFVNWLAPRTLKNMVQTSQTQFASHCILSSEKNFGAALMPIFTYKRGQLWMLESATIRSLAMTGLNVDSSWHLSFSKKVRTQSVSGILCILILEGFFLGWALGSVDSPQADLRDGRPCNYPGRLLLHPTSKDKTWINTALVKNGRTADAEMPHSRDMLTVEDISDDALPATVDDDQSTVQGAQKYQQACGVCSSIKLGPIFNRTLVHYS